MNLLFLITAVVVLYGRTSNAFSLDIPHNLLIVPKDVDAVEESYTPDRTSYNFTSGEPIQVDPRDTDLVGLNLTAPFLVTAIFKSYNGKPLCLFSIKQDDRVVMSLCIQPAGPNISRITLRTELYSPDDSICALIGENYRDKWMKIVVYVRDGKANIYVNCVKLPDDQLILSKDKDVLLTEDMKITLAFSSSIRSRFEGLIEDISLYTNANEDTLLYVCSKEEMRLNTRSS